MPLPHSINEDIHTVSEFHRMAMILWSQLLTCSKFCQLLTLLRMYFAIVDSCGPTICIYNSTGQSYIRLRSEDQAIRGPEQVLRRAVYRTSSWQIPGSAQNKNRYVMPFWYYIVYLKYLKVWNTHSQYIAHIYLVCGQDVGEIERKAKKTVAVCERRPDRYREFYISL